MGNSTGVDSGKLGLFDTAAAVHTESWGGFERNLSGLFQAAVYMPELCKPQCYVPEKMVHRNICLHM